MRYTLQHEPTNSLELDRGMEARNEEEENAEAVAKSIRGRKIILILDMAQLETVKTKKGEFQLLNCDDHLNIMKKHNKDPQQYRPDILHQVFIYLSKSRLF
jgi:rRNA pseudouridine-1189 N-methylase Emg1 (Nep1/Mra1 family)